VRRRRDSAGKLEEPGNPRGKWLVSALHAMLKNEVYIGRKIWNKSTWVKNPDTGRKERRERPDSEWIVTECEAIIERQTWDAAQRRFKGRAMATRSQRQLLSGILECGLCRSKMIISGGFHRRYRCGQNHHGGADACSFSQTFAQKDAEQLVLAPIIDELLSDQAIKTGVAEMRRARSEMTKREAAPTVSPAVRELRELERMVREGILSAETAQPAIDVLRRRIDTKTKDDSVVVPMVSPEAWRDAVVRMRTILVGDDLSAARDIMRELVGVLPCTPGEDRSYVNLGIVASSAVLMTGTGRISSGSGGRI
jgi:hypothetical protein